MNALVGTEASINEGTKERLSPETLKQLFTEARSHHFWQKRPVPNSLLQEIYDLSKWGPTGLNSSPMRIMFVISEEGKKRLNPALSANNVRQVAEAPVVAIISFDMDFPKDLPHLFPAYDARPMFADESFKHETAFRNGTLQGAYFILAARALGLDVCPMSGFDNEEVDAEFLKGTAWKSNFICTLGFGDTSKVYPRGPRLEFEKVCTVI